MLVAIVGPRNLSVDISKYIPERATGIISGGAKGIDSIVEKYTEEKKIAKWIIKPEYDKYRKAAPLKRNEIIIDMSDLVIAIWNGKSHGTKYVIDYAKKVGKPVEVHIIDQN